MKVSISSPGNAIIRAGGTVLTQSSTVWRYLQFDRLEVKMRRKEGRKEEGRKGSEKDRTGNRDRNKREGERERERES